MRVLALVATFFLARATPNPFDQSGSLHPQAYHHIRAHLPHLPHLEERDDIVEPEAYFDENDDIIEPEVYVHFEERDDIVEPEAYLPSLLSRDEPSFDVWCDEDEDAMNTAEEGPLDASDADCDDMNEMDADTEDCGNSLDDYILFADDDWDEVGDTSSANDSSWAKDGGGGAASEGELGPSSPSSDAASSAHSNPNTNSTTSAGSGGSRSKFSGPYQVIYASSASPWSAGPDIRLIPWWQVPDRGRDGQVQPSYPRLPRAGWLPSTQCLWLPTH